ncbi:MAG: FdhF/YdeP family oxidoreductase [Alphaproteobacteria bacterium]|nr:FdhF/YdeP family oxidoreductase [Alphaproteobacteria bacterium]
MTTKPAIGGGAKKVLYTLATVQRIGVGKAAKALTSHNTCKACGLGMGGQRGGMTDELGEFPAVCNKSVQAQSTDIQPPIPREVFEHSLADLRDLSGRELEQLGRLNFPLHKAKGSDRYEPIGWDRAMEIAGDRFSGAKPDRTFFYSSGRSSNEAGFLLQLLARVYGTNNVHNCSYYCHQATSVALAGTIGTGTATVELEDLTGCDLIFVVGANPASNHPRFIHKLKACRDRGGQVIVINPAKEPGLVKFALPKNPASMLSGGSEIASDYLQPRIGGDIALFKGLAKAVMAQGGVAMDFVSAHTEGFEAYARDIQETGWDAIVAASGVAQRDVERVAAEYIRSKSAIFAWGMGMTHHLHGVANIESLVNLALLRGMIGRRHAGLLPLRGHSNVQGVGTIGVKPVLAADVMARMESELGVTLPTTPGLDTMASMQAAHRGDIDAALMMGGNLYASNPDAAWAEAALAKIGFKLFLTTTLNRGHVCGLGDGEALVLPVTARDEEWEPTTQESMFNYVRLSDGGVHRLSSVRPETMILADLGVRIAPDRGVDFSAFGKHSNLRRAIAAIVPGMEALADIDVAKREFHIRNRLMHTPVFQTPTGKAAFIVRAIPAHEEKAPFMLSTVRSEGQFNSIVYQETDAYRRTATRWCVMMNADDMAELGIPQGAHADVRSPQGEMAGVVVYAFDLPHGNLLAYFPEANVLTGAAVDPRSRTPAFKATPVWVSRAAASS